MIHDSEITRRSALVIAAAGVGTATVAACSSGSSSSPAVGGQAKQETSAAAGANLAKLTDITVGEAISGKLPDGSKVLIARPTADTAACFSAICTHMGCTVAPAGKELHCPCHGSVYNATTGAVIKGPAPKALPPIAVHVVNGEVVSGS